MPSAEQVCDAAEVGYWSLTYHGPTFRVQLRIDRATRTARIDGWMDPPQPGNMVLSTLAIPGPAATGPITFALLGRPGGSVPRLSATAQCRVEPIGRFEFASVPCGPSRLSFHSDAGGLPIASPPVWI